MASSIQERLEVLDQIFGSGSKYSKFDLQYLIKDRTGGGQSIGLDCLAKDLGRLKKRCEEYGVTLVIERSGPGGSRRYSYAQKGDTVFPKAIGDDDWAVLQLVQLYLRKLERTGLLDRFRCFLKRQARPSFLDHLEDPASYVQVHHSFAGKKLESFMLLLQHILEGDRQLRITYRKPDGENRTYCFSPYFLKESPNAWFVVGMETVSRKQRIISLALNRIQAIEPTQERVVTCPSWLDRQAWYRDCIGLNRRNCYDVLSEAPASIQLRFTKRQAAFLIEEPLHPSQSLTWVEEDGRTVFTFHLIPNVELCQKILGYGAEVEVLQPLALREHIISRMRGALSLYEGAAREAELL